ncbi:DUF3822 family protein [Polaribacter sp.]|nr:DUF3822 family protein [Polaribacter sp.]MDB0039804.1 DUF3822 family protein [Polaribacter sp.]MDB9848654.1 DUF3822 family protein [Polaribacter sp.]MDB9888315.1 DUF3822 family protein [Polaribacter sp.]MDC0086021.1 DUF3822 family protein [Polaribacter sp.]
MQKKTIKTTLEKSNHHKLSIQYTLDGFSFCITNLDSQETIHFCAYTFPKTLETPEKLVAHFETIFQEDNHLQEDFKEILVIHQNSLATLVPNKLFREEHLKEYLDFNIKTLKTDFFAFDNIDQLAAKNVYVPFVNVNNYLFQNFGEFEYQHSTTAFIKRLLQTTTTPEKTMFVDVWKDQISVVVLEDKKVLFSNSFSFTSKEDFIYYLLFTAEQLELNTNEFPLFFTGDIQEETEIYKITYQYIRNVDFLRSKNPIFMNSNFSNHTHFILLG